MRTTLVGIALGLLLVHTLGAQPNPADSEQAIREILRVGGAVHRNANLPGKPVVSVELAACPVTSAGLKLLPALTELQSLDL